MSLEIEKNHDMILKNERCIYTTKMEENMYHSQRHIKNKHTKCLYTNVLHFTANMQRYQEKVVYYR